MLTPSQEQALRYDHHLVVTANAGAGKTHVLVERYLELLLGGNAGVDQLVALTFTEKAASELKRRIAERVAGRAHETVEPRLKHRFEVMREQLPSAVICTIHSFCARILREFPVEAGVDAGFTVVEGSDQQTLLQDSISETFTSILKGEEEGEVREGVAGMVRRIGKAGVLHIINTLAGKRELVERMTGEEGLYSYPDEYVLGRWRNHLQDVVRSCLRDPGLVDDLRQIIGVSNGRDASAVEALVRAFQGAEPLPDMARLYMQMMERILKKDGSLRKSFAGSERRAPREAGAAGRLYERFRYVQPLVRSVLDGKADDLHQELLRRTRCLLWIHLAVMERYEKKKNEDAQLDFEDLQLRTRNLLTKDIVRKRLMRRYRYFMVDEYQDTNRLQYEILSPLLDGLSTGNLFVVGDPKQSIYGFRDADVSVFEATGRDIRQAAGPRGHVVLKDSFRPLTDIVAFVNRVFSSLMQNGRHAGTYEVGYDPLVKARDNASPGRVEILVREPGADDGRRPDAEGELIARRILQLHGSGYRVFDMLEKPHEMLFSDVAILLRSRRLLPNIEQSLIRHHIPYVVSGGAGYFQTQDVLDFWCYFQFLLNPDDDVALVGVLRSPFFSVSDAELYEFAGGRGPLSLWRYLESHPARVGQCRSVARAVAILREDLCVGLRLTVPELISHIARQTSYLAKLAGLSGGGQSKANFQKLYLLAQHFEGRGFTNLYDFVKRLKYLIEHEEQEGQAALHVQGNAVQIMTIHGAKGLEFPIVVVPGLEKPFRVDGMPFLDESLGIGHPLDRDDEEDPPIVEYLKSENRKKAVAEEKRVFYVACTRARDMLILSGALAGRREHTSWMRWCLEGLGVVPPLRESRVDIPSSTMVLTNRDGRPAIVALEHTLSVHVLRTQDVAPVPEYAGLREFPQRHPKVLIGSVPGRPRGELFSASRLRTYRECPALYRLRYELGLPTSWKSVADPPDESEDQDGLLTADRRGKVFHKVLERIDDLETDMAGVSREIRNQLVSEELKEVPPGEVEAIERMIQGVVGSEFWREVSSGHDARTEFAITAAFGTDYLTGTIDRLYRDREGLWNLIDFKTDAVGPELLEQRVKSYEFQVGFYAYLLHRLVSASRVRATVWFASWVARPFHSVLHGPDFGRIESEIEEIIARIRDKEFQPPATPCPGCPFLPSGCPSRIH